MNASLKALLNEQYKLVAELREENKKLKEDNKRLREWVDAGQKLVEDLISKNKKLKEENKKLKDDATEKVDKLLNGAKKACENIWI